MKRHRTVRSNADKLCPTLAFQHGGRALVRRVEARRAVVANSRAFRKRGANCESR